MPCPDTLARSRVPRCLLRGGTSKSPHIPIPMGSPRADSTFPVAPWDRQGQPASPMPPMAEQSETRLWRRSQGRADKRPAGAVGQDEAMQAGASPPAGSARAVISTHTRTLRPTRWELLRSGLLIASLTALVRGDMASQALLHEASGVGAAGVSHPGPAPWLAQAPIATPHLLADGLDVPHGGHCAWLTGQCALSCNPTPDLPTRVHARWRETRPLTLPDSWQGAGGPLALRSTTPYTLPPHSQCGER